ncbi:MAG TPA: protein translocase subunit SecD [Acidimicrobiales bacterium]|nr:protein translocase subunit SecD [Acidimicrobiales bacterium]
MKKSLWYSLIGILAVAIVALGFTLAEGNKPLLGLDLEGGASVVLQPQAKVSNSVLDQAIAIISKRIDKLGVAEPSISRQGSTVDIELPGIKDPQQVLSTIGQTAELLFRPVLCTSGTGSSAQITPFPPYSPPSASTTTTNPQSTTTTAPGATTTAPGATTTAPAATSTTKAGALAPLGGGRIPASGVPVAALAGSALTASPALSAAAPSAAASSAGAAPAATPAPTYSSSDCQLATTTVASALPTTTPDNDLPNNTVLLPQADNTGNGPNTSGARFLLGPAQLTGKVVATATANPPDSNSPQWYVQIQFTSSGGPAFNKLAAANYQQFVAIDLDGLVESTPQIQQANYNGSAIINGSTFTETEAKNLALELQYGSLPVKFSPQSIETVSATIGKDSLKAGLLSGAIGLLLVLLYMLFYYRALGVVVAAGLTVSGMLLYAIISQLSKSSGLALSLAGATGIIVSVGVTADSYIVYFERLKDEIRSGKSVRSSVERGFSRAYRTILAADLVSLLAAVILYFFTVSSVRGFAFFLGLSTLLDLFTAFFFTRPMVALLGRSRFFTEARIFGVARGLAVAPAGGD